MLGRTLLVGAAIAATPAVAAQPENARFKGPTSQDKKVTLVTRGGDIERFATKVTNSCGATDKPLVIQGKGRIAVKDNGKFKVVFGANELVVSGRFTGDEVKGKFRWNYKDPLFGRCDTGKVTFEASR